MRLTTLVMFVLYAYVIYSSWAILVERITPFEMLFVFTCLAGLVAIIVKTDQTNT